MKNRSRVALIAETTGSYGRSVLFGVAHYLKIHDNWSLFVDERHVVTSPPHWVINWQGDGIITRYMTPDLALKLKHKNIPIVDLNDAHGPLRFPHIGSDMPGIGRMAANHLIEKGIRKIAFVGTVRAAWSSGRLEGVLQALQNRADFCGIFEYEPVFYTEQNWADQDRADQYWAGELERLKTWVKALPRPVGIVASNDKGAHHVLEVCRALELTVPDEVAVIGVDNTEFLCELSSPSLSSVIPDGERIGYEAASLLTRLMKGEKQEKPLTIAPRGVASRQSTDIVSLNDPLFSKALRFMREHACDGIDLGDVLNHVSISRATLDRCFQQHAGHSATAELRLIRLKRVKQLLEETDFALPQIAELAGFEHPEYMMAQFKRLVGQTPSQWRNAHFTRARSQSVKDHI
jgi:LacI family transcriptional regulator